MTLSIRPRIAGLLAEPEEFECVLGGTTRPFTVRLRLQVDAPLPPRLFLLPAGAGGLFGFIELFIKKIKNFR